ncbi:hypothetical protein BDQ12DRAFT_765952, partial [Crucibulum laeve]
DWSTPCSEIRITHQSLQCLEIYDPKNLPQAGSADPHELIQQLYLPELSELYLSLEFVNTAVIHDLIKRSRCNLRILCIDATSRTSGEVLSVLVMTPMLHECELKGIPLSASLKYLVSNEKKRPLIPLVQKFIFKDWDTGIDLVRKITSYRIDSANCPSVKSFSEGAIEFPDLGHTRRAYYKLLGCTAEPEKDPNCSKIMAEPENVNLCLERIATIYIKFFGILETLRRISASQPDVRTQTSDHEAICILSDRADALLAIWKPLVEEFDRNADWVLDNNTVRFRSRNSIDIVIQISSASILEKNVQNPSSHHVN